MIKTEDLYRATRDGQDIILLYYPQAAECFAEPKRRKFKARTGEKTASATVFFNEKKRCWGVVDFGDEGSWLSPVDVCMKEEGCRFSEAVLKLAAQFDVRDELDRSVNKPEWSERDAEPGEEDGHFFYKTREKGLTPEALRILGPNVQTEHAESLGWQQVEYTAKVRGAKVKYQYATEHYPILVRRCSFLNELGKEDAFLKFYFPLNPDKGFRFTMWPAGKKPKDYIHGLFELQRAWRAWNTEQEAVWHKDPANDGKPYQEQKLGEAFICSGERDALCCRSMGYWPLWLNSETATLSGSQKREILKYVERLYNIPDIDETGRRKGRELALQHIDIATVWLPESLKTFRDNRGRPRKDLRDWMEIYDRRADFRDLLQLAVPAQFWTSRRAKDGTERYDVTPTGLFYFLSLNGFHRLHDENSDRPRFVRVEGNVVRQVQPSDVRAFIFQWAERQSLPIALRDVFYKSQILNSTSLENLPEVDLDFTSFTATKQYFFFPNTPVEVSGEGIRVFERGERLAGRYVWAENVVKHEFHPLPPMFRCTRRPDDPADPDAEPTYDLEVLDAKSSPFFGYLINSSRLYWREELEYRLEDLSDEARRAYQREHKFSIDGPQLKDWERDEQRRTLLNKIFALGYMLHRYKHLDRAWAPQAMDNKVGDDGECNGRSGKSFFFSALSQLMKTVKLSGRNPKLMDNPHVFDQVSRDTDFLLIDDCNRYLSPSLFYDIITTDMTVNPKNNRSYTIPFADSPKLAFTTNYVPEEFSPSSDARLLYMVFSDYYHQKTLTNDYLQTRSIADDFGRALFDQDYPAEKWNADLNFLLQCCQFYLASSSSRFKPQPPMGNIMRRKYVADMGGHFEDWAETYFAEGSLQLDREISRKEAYDNCLFNTGLKGLTAQGFRKKLRAFCALKPYIHCLNPQRLLTDGKRILRSNPQTHVTEEYFYLETVAAHERELAAEAPPAVQEQGLPF